MVKQIDGSLEAVARRNVRLLRKHAKRLRYERRYRNHRQSSMRSLPFHLKPHSHVNGWIEAPDEKTMLFQAQLRYFMGMPNPPGITVWRGFDGRLHARRED